MPRILPLLIVSLALLLTGCDDSKNRLSVLSGPTMGTTWSVKYTGTPDEGVEALKGDIEAALEQVNAEMSTYRPDSSLSRFNNAEPGALMNPVSYTHLPSPRDDPLSRMPSSA